MQKLREVIKSDDPIVIKREVEELSELSAGFAARRMDASIKEALSGQSVESFDPAEQASIEGES